MQMFLNYLFKDKPPLPNLQRQDLWALRLDVGWLLSNTVPRAVYKGLREERLVEGVDLVLGPGVVCSAA